MPWYGWVGWIVLLLVIVGILIYFLVIRKKPKNVAELEKQLAKFDKDLRDAKAQLVTKAVAEKKAEDSRAAMELELLELKHAKRLKELTAKEKADYEKAKADPQSGVDFMLDLLGDGS